MLRKSIIPFSELMIDQPVDQIADKSHSWDTEEHTKHSCDASSYRNCKNNPERFESGGVSENLRTENQSVKLLQCKNHNDKDDSFYGADKKQNDCTRNCTDEWSEIWNHICDADNYTDQYGIRKPEYCHHKETDDADDG